MKRWELVGAWLGIWTPPKGVEIPPVPVRKIAWWTVGVLAAIGVALALIIPPLEQGKRQGAAERARQQAAAERVVINQLRADQRPHELVVPAGRSLAPALETAISSDARARVRAKTMTGSVRGTHCDPVPSYDAVYPHSRVYRCFVTTSADFHGTVGNGGTFASGYPFVATIYPRTRRLVWCKENPHADEKGGRDSFNVTLSPRCAGKLNEVI
jgi:type II secretory pathway pseudopilin PulG